MDSRKLAALISSLASQTLLLLILSASSSSSYHNNCKFNASIFNLIRHFLLSQEIAGSLSILSRFKKRKRTPLSESVNGEAQFLFGMSRNPSYFKSCFKINSSTFEWLCSLLEPLLDCRDPIRLPLNLSSDIRLAAGLFRLATGANYPQIATQFGVSEEIARFCAKQLCRVLCTNFRFWVAYPTLSELQSVSLGFESLAGLANCCGAIDCTRFKIANHSNVIAAQIVTDSSSRILSIAVGSCGDRDNSTVLRSSTLNKDIESGKLLNSNTVYPNKGAIGGYLIGDRSYPLLPWLMVPFVDPFPESKEDKFNAAHALMHVPVLRAISSLRKWGVLNKPIHEEVRNSVAFIGACSILHNVVLMREEEDCSLIDVSVNYSNHCKDSESTLEDNGTESAGSILRNALATRISSFRESDEDNYGSSCPMHMAS